MKWGKWVSLENQIPLLLCVGNQLNEEKMCPLQGNHPRPNTDFLMKTMWAISTRPRMIFGHLKSGKKVFWVAQNRFWKWTKFRKILYSCSNRCPNLPILLESSGNQETDTKFLLFYAVFLFFYFLVHNGVKNVKWKYLHEWIRKINSYLTSTVKGLSKQPDPEPLKVM